MNKESELKSNTDVHAGLKLRILFRIIVVVLVVILAVFGITAGMATPKDRTEHTFKTIVVNEGDNLEQVAHMLEEEGIVTNAASFSSVARLSRATSFRPGTYYLSPSMNSVAIARTMTKGITTSSGFTLPAGYTVDQIATALQRDGFASKKEFLKAASSEDLQQFDFIGKNDLGSDQIEGFLFPDKYSVDSNADESMLIMTMLNQFNNFFNEDYRARADELGLDIRQIVYIASVIESETKIDKEKAAISAVLHNRYNLGITSKKEMRHTPLCSPGAESIIAALYPEDNDNTYYVYSPELDGSHVFTNDKKEYEAMLKEYRDALEAE